MLAERATLIQQPWVYLFVPTMFSFKIPSGKPSKRQNGEAYCALTSGMSSLKISSSMTEYGRGYGEPFCDTRYRKNSRRELASPPRSTGYQRYPRKDASSTRRVYDRDGENYSNREHTGALRSTDLENDPRKNPGSTRRYYDRDEGTDYGENLRQPQEALDIETIP